MACASTCSIGAGTAVDRACMVCLASAHLIWSRCAWRRVPRHAIDQRGHGLSDKPDTGEDFATIMADLDAI
jgi:pimeloyl-ACP methyl ester carboxylesterase